jgi:ABC-type Zn2+ transport system substrate-binding protein/surface adhesin
MVWGGVSGALSALLLSRAACAEPMNASFYEDSGETPHTHRARAHTHTHTHTNTHTHTHTHTHDSVDRRLLFAFYMQLRNAFR